MKIANLILLSLLMAANAHGIEIEKKSIDVNFNNLIDASAKEKQELKQDIALEKKKMDPESQKVIDFLDLEIGIGEAPALVDRRSH